MIYLVELFLVCADWSFRSGSFVVRAQAQGVVEGVEGVLHLQMVEVEVVGLRSLVALVAGLVKSWGAVEDVAGHVTWWKYETLIPLWGWVVTVGRGTCLAAETDSGETKRNKQTLL